MIVLVCEPTSPDLPHELWYNPARGIFICIH